MGIRAVTPDNINPRTGGVATIDIISSDGDTVSLPTDIDHRVLIGGVGKAHYDVIRHHTPVTLIVNLNPTLRKLAIGYCRVMARINNDSKSQRPGGWRMDGVYKVSYTGSRNCVPITTNVNTYGNISRNVGTSGSPVPNITVGNCVVIPG